MQLFARVRILGHLNARRDRSGVLNRPLCEDLPGTFVTAFFSWSPKSTSAIRWQRPADLQPGKGENQKPRLKKRHGTEEPSKFPPVHGLQWLQVSAPNPKSGNGKRTGRGREARKRTGRGRREEDLRPGRHGRGREEAGRTGSKNLRVPEKLRVPKKMEGS